MSKASKTVTDPNGSPKRRRTQAERTAESNDRMISAAIELLLEKGTAGTTLNDVGTVAGYSRGLVSHRFGTRDKLFQAVLDRVERSWQALFREEIRGLTGWNALEKSIQLYKTLIFSDTKSYRAAMILRFELANPNSPGFNRIDRVMALQRHQVREWIEQGIRSGEIAASVNAEQIAIQHISFLYGTMFQIFLDSEFLQDATILDHYLSSLKVILGCKT